MNHMKQIAEKLPDFNLDAMLLTSAPGEFYATGFHGEGVVLITKEESFYFTDSRYIESAQAQVTGCSVTLAGRTRNYVAMIQEIVDRCQLKQIGFEEEYMSVSAHTKWSQLNVQLVPAQQLLTDLRAAKDQEEITMLVKAQEIGDAAFTEILKFIKVGMTEQEIAAKLVYTMLLLGAEKMSFDPIVVSGPNGSKPHGIPGQRKIQEGDFITMDFGCIYGGYCSDMTRTIAVGQPTEEMDTVYNLVLKAQLAGIAAARAGVTGKSIDAAARAVIEAGGYGQYFGHGYGHSLGIEIHEAPNANTVDETIMPIGAAISAEPGIYIPGKFGVRIEDVTILTEDGCIDITHSPKELIIL